MRVGLVAAVLSLAVTLCAEDVRDSGPQLYGDGAGRVWKWSGGKKVDLTPASLNLVLGGVAKNTLWGWSNEAGSARFFTLGVPKKDAKPGTPVFDKGSYPVPDLADRVGDRLLLVYRTPTGVRWEVWRGGAKLDAKAYEDRVAYAASLGPLDGWLVVGSTSDGVPWVNASGSDPVPPEGWRGRLTVTAWFSGDTAIPMAAGWGAAAGPPGVLFWEPDGWTQPAREEGAEPEPAAIYPVIGFPADRGLVLGGWQSLGGVTKPWIWDGHADPGAIAADGEIQALLVGKGKALVVKHRTPPWFTLEDGKTSVVLEGLGENDRVVAVEAPAEAPK